MADYNVFYTNFCLAYYQGITNAFKTAAPNRLFLGNKFVPGASGADPALANFCSIYADVISVDGYGLQGQLPGWFAYCSVSKPLYSSEWNVAARDVGLFGNEYDGGTTYDTQAERAGGYLQYLTNCLANANYVGAHFWQTLDVAAAYVDSDYDFGLLSVADVPYSAMTPAIRQIGANMYQTRLGLNPPAISLGTNQVVVSASGGGSLPITVTAGSAGVTSFQFSSSATGVLATNNIVVSGNGSSRTVTVTAGSQPGRSTVTITAIDANGLRAFLTFNVVVPATLQARVSGTNLDVFWPAVVNVTNTLQRQSAAGGLNSTAWLAVRGVISNVSSNDYREPLTNAATFFRLWQQ